MRHVYTKAFGSAFSVAVVPTLKDNFSYVIHDDITGTVAAVDANADWKLLQQHMAHMKWWGSADHHFAAILTTHKHHDHAGGNAGLLQAVRSSWRPDPVSGDCRVYGGAKDAISSVTHPVAGGDSLKVGSLEVRVIDVPCHTSGHVAYYVSNPERKEDGAALFTGDTLFIAGLGAFFEGSDKDMCVAMSRLAGVNNNNAAADANTFIFPGHEYTAGFMKFSAAQFPEKKSSDHKFILEQQKKYSALVSAGMPSIPSSLADEKRQNLFLRAAVDEAFRQTMGKGNAESLMNYLYNACD